MFISFWKELIRVAKLWNKSSVYRSKKAKYIANLGYLLFLISASLSQYYLIRGRLYAEAWEALEVSVKMMQKGVFFVGLSGLSISLCIGLLKGLGTKLLSFCLAMAGLYIIVLSANFNFSYTSENIFDRYFSIISISFLVVIIILGIASCIIFTRGAKRKHRELKEKQFRLKRRKFSDYFFSIICLLLCIIFWKANNATSVKITLKKFWPYFIPAISSFILNLLFIMLAVLGLVKNNSSSSSITRNPKPET